MNVQPAAQGALRHRRRSGALLSLLLFAAATLPGAAYHPPDSPPQTTRLAGMYQVVSGNDPLFRLDGSAEWFLDFASGVTDTKSSGTVAVSLRENPHLRVRILVWQFYPAENTLRIGNQTAEGSRQAVAIATWQISPGGAGRLILQRGAHELVLAPATEID